MTNGQVEEMAKAWARYELAAREAEENCDLHGDVYAPGGNHAVISSPLAGVGCNEDRPQSSREAANTILNTLLPIFQEQARQRKIVNTRPGKQWRLI